MEVLWGTLGILFGCLEALFLGPGGRLGRLLRLYWGSVIGPWKHFTRPSTAANRCKLIEPQALLRLLRGPSWAPGGAPYAPAPRQTRGKLVELWALLGLIGCLLGPSWAVVFSNKSPMVFLGLLKTRDVICITTG